MIKAVLLIDVFEDTKGGAERQIYELLKHYNRNMFKLNLCIIHQEYIPKDILELSINAVALGIKKTYGFSGIIKGFWFIRFLKKERIDVLMTYHFSSDIWGTLFAKLAGINTIISNRRDVGFWRERWHIIAYQFINNWVKKVIVVSGAIKNIVVKEERLPEEKVIVIHNGVDLSRFDISFSDLTSIRRKYGFSSSALLIVSLGNFYPIKGHIYLLRAMPKVLEAFPEARIVLVGDGPLRKQLQDLSKELNIDKHTHFLGERNEVPEILKMADICILPSLSEGLSNALLEYMAAGKAVIATDVGGNPEVIQNGANGILVPSRDSNAIAQAMVLLLENRDLARNLAFAARKNVEQSFDLEKQISKIEETLVSLTNKFNKKETRILHLISSSGLFGAEKVMLEIASGLNNGNFESLVAAIKNNHNPHLEVINKAKEMGIAAVNIESRGRFDLGTVNQLYKLINEKRIDVLHSHNYKANLVGLLAAKKANIPIVATLHGYLGTDHKLRIYENIDRFILKFFNKIIFVDNVLRSKINIKKTKFAIIPNGVETNRDIKEYNKEEPKDCIIIGCIGRLSKEKGHKYLIEAFTKLSQNFHNLRLLIVGDGDSRQELENLCIRLHIREKVDFVGFQSDTDKYYSLIDIYASPSLIEHFPMAILEAMSFSKPIVATNVGGTSKLIIDKYTGILIKPNSAEAIYSALLEFVKGPSYRRILGTNALKFVQSKYSKDIMLRNYEKIYQELI